MFLAETKKIVEEKSNEAKLNELKLTRTSNSVLALQSAPAIISKITKPEQELLAKTNPEVIEQYNQLLVEELSNFSIDLKDSPTGDGEVTYNLPQTGAKITVTSTSTLIEQDPQIGIQSYRIHRLYGKYKYEIKYKITAALYPDSICGLITNYTAKADGLRLTSASKAGTTSIFPTTIVASASITDNRAEKIGYDINAQGDYTVTIAGYNGVGLYSFDMTIISTVVWDASASNSIYVVEKYQQDGDKTK